MNKVLDKLLNLCYNTYRKEVNEMRYAEKYTIDFLAEKTGVAVEILAKQSPAALTELAEALGQFLTAQHKLNCKVIVLKAGS